MVWEICKFWILQNKTAKQQNQESFERYVNFEFYKTSKRIYTEIVSLRDM